MSSSNFSTVVELRNMLDQIIAQNPEAKLVADVDGQDFAVVEGIKLQLDNDGDAHFTLRSYSTGDTVQLKEIA